MTVLLVPPHVRSEAYALLVAYAYTKKLVQSMQLVSKRPPTFLVGAETAHTVSAVKKLHDVVAEDVEAFIQEHRHYPHVEYVLSAPAPKILALSMVAFPPQFTYRRLEPYALTPRTYITMGFIPVRIKNKAWANILQKTTYAVAKYYYTMHRQRVFAKYPALERQFKATYSKYEATGRYRATSLAIRDVFRVIIGNAWLVWTKRAYDAGLIGDDDLVLPYHLAKEPHLHAEMINPSETSDQPEKYVDATWKWLVKKVTVKIQKAQTDDVN